MRLEKEEFATHKLGYLVGKYGIEQKFEIDLMGENGGRQIEVNAMGQKIRLLGQVEPNPGNNLYLTLDLELQKAAEEAMAGKRGAVVALDPRNGDILAMVSKPDFDPNLFARGINPESWKAISGNPAHPLQNRAIQGQYPPGSVFKIIMAIAGLEEKIITPETSFHCPGSYSFAGREYHCWKKEGHGQVSLRRAIVESCDVYFYKLGMRLGVNRIAKYASIAGLGSPTGFPLGREKPGLVPTSSWKMKTVRDSLAGGKTYRLPSGRGIIWPPRCRSPAPSRPFSTGGSTINPALPRASAPPMERTSKSIHPWLCRNIQISPETIELVREALWGVVNSPGGTGGKSEGGRLQCGGEDGDFPGRTEEGGEDRTYVAGTARPCLVRLLCPGLQPGDRGGSPGGTRRGRRRYSCPGRPPGAGELL